jgi:hypothetical protein
MPSTATQLSARLAATRSPTNAEQLAAVIQKLRFAGIEISMPL